MTKLMLILSPISWKFGIIPNYNRFMFSLKIGSLRPACLKNNLLLRISIKNNHNVFFHTYSNNKTDKFLEEDCILPIPRNTAIEEHSEQFRSTLYPFSNDPITIHIKNCQSIDELRDILNTKTGYLTSENYCQVILVLWDLVFKLKSTSIQIEKLQLFPCNIPVSYLRNCTDSDFVECVNYIVYNVLDSLTTQDYLEKLTPEEITCTVLFSNRLGASFKHPSIQALLMEIDKLLLEKDDNKCSIAAISRLTLALTDEDELWAKLFLLKTTPLIYKHFDNCRSPDDFRALTISLLSTAPYLEEDTLLQFEELTERFLRNGSITQQDVSIIIKAILLLSKIFYSENARCTVYKLFQMLSGNLNKLFWPYIFDIQKVTNLHLEPRYTIAELEKLKRHPSLQVPSNLDIRLPLLAVPSGPHGSVILKDMIRKADNLYSLLWILNLLTTAHWDSCQLLWGKIAHMLMSTDQPIDSETLQKVCSKYLFFSIRMNSYRNKNIESIILQLITSEIVNGEAGYSPRVFANFASFVMAFDYHHHGKASLLNDVMPRILSMMKQFGLEECFYLSKGFKHGMQFRRKEDLQLYLQVDSAFDARTKELMVTEDLTSIHKLNMILRSCINRKGILENEISNDLLRRCDFVNWKHLTSRSARNLVYNLHILSALVPTALDNVVEYCLQNGPYVIADTVAKVAHLCYHLGYLPPHCEAFSAITADIVIRDYKMLNGLTLLRLALALNFFNQLPTSLIRIIFSVEFLETLDDEIKSCFAKDKYPLRVRQCLMELNRSVCLDKPEADVPWFHSKFCEEQQALGLLEPRPKNLLFTDVLRTMVDLLGDSSLVNTKAYTPYGYSVDIQLNLDSDLNPIPVKSSENAVHKLAFLLHYGDSFTTCQQQLRGYHQMKRRHMEILGYKVIELSDSLWNSMFMAEPKAKLEYLRSCIWPYNK